MKHTLFAITLFLFIACQSKKVEVTTDSINASKEYSNELVPEEGGEDELVEYEASEEGDQDKVPEDYNKCPDNSDKLVPLGYCQQEKIIGDLNKDGLDDYILIVKNTDKEAWERNQFDKLVDRNRRGIIIAFNDGGGAYRQIVANLSCFASEYEDGGVYFAPEMSVDINKKGNLQIHYAHGRYGYWDYIFRYQNNAFELIGHEVHSNRGPIPLSITSINFSTKKIHIANNVSEDSEIEKWENTLKDIDSTIPEYKELLRLENVDHFENLSF